MRPTSASNQIPALKFTIRVSWLIGVFNKKQNIRGFLAICSLGFLALEILLDGILNWNGVQSLSRMIYLPSAILGCTKGACQVIKSKEVVNLATMIKHFWRADDFDQKTADKINKVFHTVTRIVQAYVGFILVFCVFILPLPFLDRERKTLLFSDFSFCNLQNLICWICNYTWQCILLIFHAVPANIGFDLFFILFTCYVYTACQLLHAGLQKLNSENPEYRKYMLKKIVNQHDLVMNFVMALNQFSSKVMFLQFTLTLWSLVLCSYMIVANEMPPSLHDITYFGGLYIIFANQLFLYSYSGAIIEEEIRKVSYSIFVVEWYEKERTGLRKDLSLMIQRAQNTKSLNAGKMSDLNLTLFVATLKNALSIVMLIVQMANQGNGLT